VFTAQGMGFRVEAIEFSTAGVASAFWRDEPALGRWPGWLRAVVLFVGGAGTWTGLAWVVLLMLSLH
jgi:hypothetical protein